MPGIIASAVGRIIKGLVRYVNRAHFNFSFGVIRMEVGVVLPGFPEIRPTDTLVVGVTRHSQSAVVVRKRLQCF